MNAFSGLQFFICWLLITSLLFFSCWFQFYLAFSTSFSKETISSRQWIWATHLMWEIVTNEKNASLSRSKNNFPSVGVCENIFLLPFQADLWFSLTRHEDNLCVIRFEQLLINWLGFFVTTEFKILNLIKFNVYIDDEYFFDFQLRSSWKILSKKFSYVCFLSSIKKFVECWNQNCRWRQEGWRRLLNVNLYISSESLGTLKKIGDKFLWKSRMNDHFMSQSDECTYWNVLLGSLAAWTRYETLRVKSISSLITFYAPQASAYSQINATVWYRLCPCLEFRRYQRRRLHSAMTQNKWLNEISNAANS